MTTWTSMLNLGTGSFWPLPLTTADGTANASTAATCFWNVRLSDGSTTVVAGESALAARAAVEAAERGRILIGQRPRTVVQVTSA